MRPLRAAVVQLEVGLFDAEANRAAALAAAEREVAGGADLIVLPELANSGFLEGGDLERTTRLHACAEPVDGPFVSGLRDIAAGKAHIVSGFLERGEHVPGTLHNSLALVRPDGAVDVYRKTHLPRNEKLLYTRGNALAPVPTDLGVLGLLVCADNSFPEAARALALGGCEILVVSLAAGRTPNPRLYPSIAATRAYENQLFVVAANQAGPSERGTFAGHSAIAAPDGRLLVELDEAPGSVAADLDPELLLSERLRQTRYADRRPDLYDPLVDR